MGLLSFTLNALSGRPYYVRLQRNRLIVSGGHGKAVFDDEPILALSDESPPRVLGVGASAKGLSPILVNPFAHPRVLVADFLLAEKVMMHAFSFVSGRSSIRSYPTVVLHVTEELDGGLSSLETRALMELCEGAGAYETYLWDGHVLSDEEIQDSAYRTVAKQIAASGGRR